MDYSVNIRKRREDDKRRKQEQRSEAQPIHNSEKISFNRDSSDMNRDQPSSMLDQYLLDQRIKQRQHETRKEQKRTYIQGKRECSQFRLEEKERDRENKQLKRMNPAVRQQEAFKDCSARKLKRTIPEVREKELAMDRTARKLKRTTSEVREKEASRETPARKLKRTISEVREKELAIDRTARKLKRTTCRVREKEATRETPARKLKRTITEVHEKELAMDKTARKLKRTTSEVRKKEASRETPARKLKRTIHEVRAKELAMDRTARKLKRTTCEVREKEATRETPARKVKRVVSEIHEREVARETPARKLKRSNDNVRQQQNARETAARRNKRALPSDAEKGIRFKQQIRCGPTFVCTCCCRLLYRSTVTEFLEKNFTHCSSQLLRRCRTNTGNDGKEYICNACKTSLKQNTIPVFSPANNMDVDEIPEQLTDLNTLEATFIARRIPFMKIMALPRGKQKSIHGCVLNIPVEPDECVSVLPRVASPDSMVLVQLKRKLQYRGHSFRQNIRPQKVKEALHVLKHALQNPLYSDVVVDDDWQDSSAQKDPELWNALISPTTDPPDDDEQQQENTEDDQDEIEDCRSRLSGLPFNTCLQPKDISSDENIILSIASGEGKKPRSMDSDLNSEELSFPHLFPSGKYGFSMPCPKKLTLKKYFQAKILHNDGRFSQQIEYLFLQV